MEAMSNGEDVGVGITKFLLLLKGTKFFQKKT